MQSVPKWWKWFYFLIASVWSAVSKPLLLCSGSRSSVVPRSSKRDNIFLILTGGITDFLHFLRQLLHMCSTLMLKEADELEIPTKQNFINVDRSFLSIKKTCLKRFYLTSFLELKYTQKAFWANKFWEIFHVSCESLAASSISLL